MHQFQILALPLINSVGKLLNLSEPQFLICKMGPLRTYFMGLLNERLVHVRA